MKIIVRMPNWMGDLVMATPILTDLRRAFPDAHITAMARMPFAQLLNEDPDIDELFSFTKISPFVRHDEKRNYVQKLRQGKYDLGILLTNSFSSAWWFWQAQVKQRIGYEGRGRSWLLTAPVRRENTKEHLVITYKKVLAPLNIPISTTSPRLFITEKEKNEARELLKKFGITDNQTVIAINPGATFGSAKCWLPDRFREVTDKFLKHPEFVMIYLGDQTQMATAQEICKTASPRVIDLTGLTTVREMASIISLADVLLTNDSGPMHVADALGISVVALFGSTDHEVTGPFNQKTVIRKEVSCSPCFKRECPIDFRCMKSIETDEVYAKVLSLLNI